MIPYIDSREPVLYYLCYRACCVLFVTISETFPAHGGGMCDVGVVVRQHDTAMTS